jgi:hypothetical protein
MAEYAPGDVRYKKSLRILKNYGDGQGKGISQPESVQIGQVGQAKGKAGKPFPSPQAEETN